MKDQGRTNPGSCGIVAAAAVLLLGGCAALKQEYPVKNRFAPELEREAAPASTRLGGVLRVRDFSVAPQWSGEGFVYRTGPLKYETDYYNEFLVPPGALFGAVTREWFANSGLFETVTGPESSAVPGHVLEGSISEMYGNVVSGEEPVSVLEMSFLVYTGPVARSGEYFQRRYLKEVPLDEVSAWGVMQGWNRGLEEILRDLEGELRNYLQEEKGEPKESKETTESEEKGEQ